VAIDNGAFRATVVVAHARGKATADVRKAWWSRLTDVIRGARSEVLLLIDANARVGSVTSDSIGPGGFPQQQDDNGELFHQLLSESSLLLPATFCEIDPSHATRAGHRTDFVATPFSWKHTVKGAFTRHDFDPLVRFEDRYPAVVDFETTLPTGKLRGLNGPSLDAARTTDPATVADFAVRLRDLPAIPWITPVDAHVDLLSRGIREAASAAFPRDNKVKSFKPYICDATSKVVRFRKMLQRNLRRVRSGRYTLIRWPATQAAFSACLEDFTDVEVLGLAMYCLRALTLEAEGPEPWAPTVAGHLSLLHGLMAGLTKADRAAFLETVAVSFGPAMSRGAGKAAWKAIRTILGRLSVMRKALKAR